MAARRKGNPSDFLDEQDKRIAQELDEFCSAIKESGGDASSIPDPIDSNKLWKFVYKCAFKSPNMMFSFNFSLYLIKVLINSLFCLCVSNCHFLFSISLGSVIFLPFL